jgi:metallo-beta-lactamase family protein
MRRLALAFALLLPLAAQAPKEAAAAVTVAVHGAAGEVDGSLTVVRHGARTYLVDCGVHLGDDKENAARNRELPVDPEKLDGVFITHAHADHMGKLPLLVRKGYRGPIHCTRGSEQLMAVGLPMSIRYESSVPRMWQWSRARVLQHLKLDSTPRAARPYQVVHFHQGCNSLRMIQSGNKEMYSGTLAELRERLKVSVNPCRECGNQESRQMLSQLKGHTYGERLPLPDGGAFTLLDAGHIPGSASVLLELGGKRLLFSGDMGHDLNPLQAGAPPAPPVDAVWVESTYGGQVRKPEVADESRRFVEAIAACVKEGGVAWIPAYALDRTQKVLYLILQAQAQGLISKQVPIHCQSPTAVSYTQLYEAEVQKPSLDRWFRPEVYKLGGVWPWNVDREIRPDLKGPAILITTTAVLDEPDHADMAEARLADPKTKVLMVGYSDPDARGGQLKRIVREGKAAEIVFGDRRVMVEPSRLQEYRFLSGHLDLNDVKGWLSRQDKAKVRITTVHGEPSSLAKLRDELKAAGFANVTVAERGKPVPMGD